MQKTPVVTEIQNVTCGIIYRDETADIGVPPLKEDSPTSMLCVFYVTERRPPFNTQSRQLHFDLRALGWSPSYRCRLV